MLELTQWWQSLPLADRPWIVFGKGPTFARRHEHDLRRFHSLGLNHVVQELHVDVAHAIDIDVVADCAEDLLRNCRWLVMPRHPHVSFRATERRLEDFFDDYPVLRRLSEQGRLVWYNLSSSEPVDGSPRITARYFSAEAAIDLLGTLGVRRIQSLGIDGGRGYSSEFDTSRTMLANGHSTFNGQFAEIDRIAAQHGLDYQPLVEPLRVFCGTDESQRVATRVLEHSIRQHASEPVNFEPMYDLQIPLPKHPQNRPRTGFSFYRFAIPQLCGYRGRALYLDADMLVFGDLAELWQVPFEEAQVLCTHQSHIPADWRDHKTHFRPGRQLSVMMLDCERLDWDVGEIVRGLDSGRYKYEQLMFDLCVVGRNEIEERIPAEWNCLESYDSQRTRLLHYTVVPSQPWKNDQNPLRHLWEDAFREAFAAGAVSQSEVLAGIAASHLKSSLANGLKLDQVVEPAATREYRRWTPAAPSPPRPTLGQRLSGCVRNPLTALRSLGRLTVTGVKRR